MGEITEDIDLTLNCYFAGDDDFRLVPNKWIRYRESLYTMFFVELHEILEQVVRSNENSRFFVKPEEEALNNNYEMAYWRIFQDWTNLAYAEILGYGDPRHCALCRSKTDFLTRNDRNDSCDRCYYQQTTKSVVL